MPFDALVAASAPTQEVKRGRGRPRKDSAPGAGGATTTQAQTGNSPISPGSAVPSASLQSSGIPPEALRKALQLPFAVAAVQTEFSGFALSKEEAEPLVPMADMLIVKYVPNLGPYSIELLFIGSLAMLAGTKYMAYMDWKKERLQSVQGEART